MCMCGLLCMFKFIGNLVKYALHLRCLQAIHMHFKSVLTLHLHAFMAIII